MSICFKFLKSLQYTAKAENHSSIRDSERLEIKGWAKIHEVNAHEKKSRTSLFVSHEDKFKAKSIKQDTDVHFKMMKVGTSLVAQWIGLCAPNAGSPGSIPGQGSHVHAATRSPPAATKEPESHN